MYRNFRCDTILTVVWELQRLLLTLGCIVYSGRLCGFFKPFIRPPQEVEAWYMHYSNWPAYSRSNGLSSCNRGFLCARPPLARPDFKLISTQCQTPGNTTCVKIVIHWQFFKMCRIHSYIKKKKKLVLRNMLDSVFNHQSLEHIAYTCFYFIINSDFPAFYKATPSQPCKKWKTHLTQPSVDALVGLIFTSIGVFAFSQFCLPVWRFCVLAGISWPKLGTRKIFLEITGTWWVFITSPTEDRLHS